MTAASILAARTASDRGFRDLSRRLLSTKAGANRVNLRLG
jgi:hypothetical protein